MVIEINAVGVAGLSTKSTSEIIPSDLLEKEIIINPEESPASDYIASRFIVGIASAGSLSLTSAVAEAIAKRMDEHEKSELGYAHVSIDGQEVVFIDNLDLMNPTPYPEGIVVANDIHLYELLSSVEMIKEIRMDVPCFKEETFPLDFTRPIIRDQVTLKKPRNLIKKIIH